MSSWALRPILSARQASGVTRAMRSLIHSLVVAGSVLATVPAYAAQDSSPGQTTSGVTAGSAWARASAGHANTGAAYLTLTGGSQDDTLTSISTPVATTAEVHESSSEGGVMRMRAVGPLPIPAGKTVTLAPGGYHVMLMGLKHPLAAGQSFPMTLNFSHAQPMTVTVDVRPIGAAAMGGHMQMQGGMTDHQHMH